MHTVGRFVWLQVMWIESNRAYRFGHPSLANVVADSEPTNLPLIVIVQFVRGLLYVGFKEPSEWLHACRLYSHN